MKRLFLSLALILPLSAAFPQSIKGLGFEPSVVRPGEQATYTISITDASPQINLNSIPIPDGLQYAGSGQEQSMSMGTGVGMRRETRLKLYFIPTREGEFEIKSWQVKDGDKTYEIAPAKLKADPNAPQTVGRRQQDPFADPFSDAFMDPFASMRSRQQQPRRTETINLNDEMSLTLKLGKEKIYTGEAIPCSITFRISGKLLAAGYLPANILQPQVKNGDAFNCAGFFSEPEVERDGDSAAVLTYKTFITPIKAGEHDLQFEIAGELVSEGGFGGRSIFSMMNAFGERHPFQISMKPAKVKVDELPLPPPGFSNAIGSFRVDGVSLDETSLSVGTPATMTVRIAGEGNFERMSAPSLDLGGNWKEYKPKSSFEDASGGFGCRGVKTFEYTIVPNKPDIEKAPAASLVYFDPDKAAYETLTAEAPAVSVAPSKSFAKRASEDGQAAKDPLGSLADAESAKAPSDFYREPWFWGLQIAVIAGLAFLVARKRAKNRLESDSAYARTVKAQSDLKSDLKNAKLAAAENNAKAFFESAASALQNAICIASGIEARAVTLSDARSVLSKLENGGDLYASAKTYFEGADAIAFGGYAPNAGELEKLYANLEETCSKIS